MKARKVVNDTIVFFNSIGKDENGNSIKENNYSEDIEAIKDTLTVKLNTIKGELWYNVNYGIPLFEKVNKGIVDMVVGDIISEHKDIVAITKFKSDVVNRNYSLYFTADSSLESFEFSNQLNI